MRFEKAITLCAIVSVLTSCNVQEAKQADVLKEKAQVSYLARDTKEAKYTPPVIKNIRHFIKEVDLPSKLETLLDSSSYSAAKLIEASLPKLLECFEDYPLDNPYDDLYYPFRQYGTDFYQYFDKFTDVHGQVFRLDIKYSQNKNEIIIKFDDEGREIYTTSNLNDGSLDIEQWGYDKISKKYVTKIPDDIDKLKKRHIQFLTLFYKRLTAACENNPYANKVATVEEIEEAVKRTTKPTIVMTTASWCAPCRYFRRWYFDKFLNNNYQKYDVIIADMDPNHNNIVETNEELETYFKKKFDVSSVGLPNLFFLDKEHKPIGNYTDGNSDEFRSKLRSILKDAKFEDIKTYDGIF